MEVWNDTLGSQSCCKAAMKYLTLLFALTGIGVCLVFGGQNTSTDLSAFFDGNDAPLHEGINEKLVYVRDGDGKPISGARVVVDYDSVKHPPSFETDTNGCARVQVKIGFWAIRVEALQKSITVRGDVEWPLLVVISKQK